MVTDRSHDDQHHAHWSRTIETIDRSQQRENPVWPAQCAGGGGGGGGYDCCYKRGVARTASLVVMISVILYDTVCIRNESNI